MRGGWIKGSSGAVVASVGWCNVWAVEQASADASNAIPSAWSAPGLWAIAAVVVVLGMVVVGRVRRSNSGRSKRDERGALSRAIQGQALQGVPAVTPRGYSEKNVGNDASARPFERHGSALDAGTAAGSQGGWVLGERPDSPSVPLGFDGEGFLAASKANFLALQAAWNQADTASLRAMMTEDMLEQINAQLAEREAGGGNCATTEVVMLEARLLGVEDLEDHHLASVEFSGVLREEPSAGPNPFRELWSITRPKSGDGGWLVAGVQTLQ